MIHETTERILNEIKMERFISKKTLFIRLIIFSCVVFFLIIGLYSLLSRQINILLDQQSSFYLQEVATKSAERLTEEMAGDLAQFRGMALTLGSQEVFDLDRWLTVIKDDPSFSEFHRIGFMLPDGRLYTQELNGVDYSHRDYFRAVMQGNTFVSDVFFDNIHHKPTLVYAVPIIQDQKVVAGIGVGIVINEYEKYLHIPSFSGEGTIHLLAGDGTIILTLGTAAIPEGLHFEALREDFEAEKSGIFRVGEGKDQRLLAYAPVGEQGWSLLLEIPHTFLEKLQEQTSFYSLSITFLFGLLMLVLVYSVFFRRRKFESSLLKLAYMDEVTGAANYTLFVKGAELLLAKGEQTYACIVLNIHRFKLINDLFGYAYGDALLKQISDMLPSFCLEHELYGRRAGDRFLLFLKQEAVEKRMFEMLETLNKIVLPTTAQIKLEIVAGIYVIKKPLPINICIDRATLALEHLNEYRGVHYQVYNEIMRDTILVESGIIKSFQEGLDSRQFFVELQPKFNMVTAQVVGAEALVRWNHPTRGLLSPLQFIPVLEENNLITELDMFVLRQVCENLQNWQRQGLAVLPISVNQSRKHLEDARYVDNLIHVVDNLGISHSLLELELTESIFLHNLDHLETVINSLRKEGFNLSIDDFGSGFSSLTMLKNIKVDYLKLDREFLLNAEDDLRSQKVIRNIIKMAHDLDLLVVAEGVETKEQAKMLMEMGCTLAQGYYWAKPLSIGAYEKLLVTSP